MSVAAAGALAAALEASAGSLREVTLGGHRFEKEEAMATVLDGVAKCSGLEVLDLTNTSLGGPGGSAVAEVMRTCTSLHTVQLEDCTLEEDGCME